MAVTGGAVITRPVTIPGWGAVPVATGIPGSTASATTGCDTLPVTVGMPTAGWTFVTAALLPVAVGLPAKIASATTGCGAVPVAVGIPALTVRPVNIDGAITVPVAVGIPAKTVTLGTAVSEPAAVGMPGLTSASTTGAGAVPVAVGIPASTLTFTEAVTPGSGTAGIRNGMLAGSAVTLSEPGNQPGGSGW